jgi:hypothetical protein
MFYLRNHEIYVKLYQTIVSLVCFILETMRSMSNYIRQLSPLYTISQKPWDLCQLCQIDNCLPCMFYLRNHEIYVKLYQTIVSLVHFISEIMRAMPIYQIDNCLPCMFYLRNHKIYVKLYQIDNCHPCMFYLRNHKIYVKLYQTIVSLVPFISETIRTLVKSVKCRQ